MSIRSEIVCDLCGEENGLVTYGDIEEYRERVCLYDGWSVIDGEDYCKVCSNWKAG